MGSQVRIEREGGHRFVPDVVEAFPGEIQAISVSKPALEDVFIHRTGHSIGTVLHGNGANLDNYETQDDRVLLPNTCCSVEPGIYLPEFGIRSEVNLLVFEHDAEITGVPPQQEITPLL